MLIREGDGEGAREGSPQREDHSHEYQTASELFEMMARDHNFSNCDDETLSTRDLVILYKNIDLGTKLMSKSGDYNNIRRPNQHVESIVYADEPESDSSEISDIYSTEDLHNVFVVNKERIDLFNNRPSFENTLSHKLGDLEIQCSELSTDYEKYFLFQDPYIKQQLKSLNLTSNESEQPALPASLLDYICCQRLEDNYNFYMENIIRYVKQSIEHLKRISNGDYLTDRVKEKWREVENVQNDQNKIVLATSTSIPLHVERKTSGLVSSWDDLVHSEVDVRSLSKILEKKIVLEIPKLICGTYKLFSKRCSDNLIISCKREKSVIEEDDSESRVDVVLQLERSQSGHVMSNINSIMILNTAPNIPQDSCSPVPLSLSYKNTNEENSILEETRVKIIEIESSDDTKNNIDNSEDDYSNNTYNCGVSYDDSSILDTNDYPGSENGDNLSSKSHSYQESSESGDALRDILAKKDGMVNKKSNLISSDELRLTMQRLNMQTILPEESGEDLSPRGNQPAPKMKSPTRVRIKSPYENKSHLLEEKKRKKLLEIREKRERKKMALGESCKISKHKYGKCAVTPQASNSVTKLSITNKSFYNSIYGQSVPAETNQPKGKLKNLKKDPIPEILLDDLEGENEKPLETLDKNNKKFINRSYYLDDAVTEMMYLESKQNDIGDAKEIGSTSTSTVSNDFRANLTLLSQLIGPSESDFNSHMDANLAANNRSPQRNNEKQGDDNERITKDISIAQCTTVMAPANTPKRIKFDENVRQLKKTSSSVECRKSIEEIYDLMKKIGMNEMSDAKSSKKELTNPSEKAAVTAIRENSMVQGSDSGTSLKHCLTSDTSSFSFDKTNVEVTKQKTNNTKSGTIATVVPKVIMNTKSQAPRIDKMRKDMPSVSIPAVRVPESPLKAISQLLHEFDNVQRTRQKMEEKSFMKTDVPFTDRKRSFRQNYSRRRAKIDQHRDVEVPTDRFNKAIFKERQPHPPPIEMSKIPHQQIAVEDKHDKVVKKKIADIIDEAKEARGEAVRGPCKFPSRLDSLAQPKRSYVQAHSEEYHSRYGRNLMADRLQRLAANPLPSTEKNFGSANTRNKLRRPETVSSISMKQTSPVPPLEKPRRPASSGLVNKVAVSAAVAQPYKHNVPNTPETLIKMVAVESYVNSHYGSTPAADDLPHHAHKSRVPLLPHDIDLASVSSNNSPKESTKLGSKLHSIIDSMINANTPDITVHTEGCEINSKLGKNNTDYYFSDKTRMSKGDERGSMDSDYQIDILQDKNVETAVNASQQPKKGENIVNNVTEAINAVKYDIQPFSSSTEIEKLENELYRRLSVGAFHKRLRIKKLTLTPKQSMQQVLVLQSGDARSIVVKTTDSHDLKVNKGDSLCDLKSLPVLSQTRLDWNFANFPIQISTVGYAFPNYQKVKCATSSRIITVGDITNKKNKDTCFDVLNSSKAEKISQCSKGYSHDGRTDQGAQVNVLCIDGTLEGNRTNKIVVETHTNVEEKVEDKATATISEDFQIHKTMVTQHNKQVKDIETDATNNTDDVDFTTSLDMLVGLLNEIQKITSCQTQIANAEAKDEQCKELETILNSAVTLDSSSKVSPNETVSNASFGKLKQLESSPSIDSFFLTNDKNSKDKKHNMNVLSTVENIKPITVDQEVSANFLDREYVHKFTYVPSQLLFPITLNRSTNVTNSMIGILSEPSTQSMFSFDEYETLYANCSFDTSKTSIELSKAQKSDASHHSLVPYKQAVENAKISKKFSIKLSTSVANVDTQKHNVIKQMKRMNRRCVNADIDPSLTMKRDILVTMYSILVFTVFAALSFPEVMNIV